MQVKIKLLSKDAMLPLYSTPLSAGADLFLCDQMPYIIHPGENRLLHTGIAIQLPKGYVALIFARSGLAAKQGLRPANCVGVIDADYTGEILVAMYNDSKEEQIVRPKDRIAQMVIVPYLTAEWQIAEALEKTVRGDGGFGSTGIHFNLFSSEELKQEDTVTETAW